MQFFPRRVYADAAAATPLSPRARKTLSRLLYIYGNAGGFHQEALEAKRELEEARGRVAEALDAHRDEILFTGGGTEGNNMALGGAVSALSGRYGDIHVLMSVIEHPSVLEPLRAMALEGHIELTELPVERDGRLDLKVFKEAIRPNTALVSIQMINSEMGTIQDIREIAKIIRHERRKRSSEIPQERGKSSAEDFPMSVAVATPNVPSEFATSLPLIFHTDASQAPLWLPLAVWAEEEHQILATTRGSVLPPPVRTGKHGRLPTHLRHGSVTSTKLLYSWVTLAMWAR